MGGRGRFGHATTLGTEAAVARREIALSWTTGRIPALCRTRIYPGAMSTNTWRAVISALADDRARDVYARIVLAQPVDEALDALSPGKRRRVLDTLLSAGLISPDGAGWRTEPEVFRDALRSAPAAPRAAGVDRFFVDGRLTVYPSRAADRDAVLLHIVGRMTEPGEILTERAVNDRLAAIVDDVAAMRRYLVDAGLLERSRDGGAYSRAR